MAKRGAHKATKKGATKKPIESYDHQDKKRANNPPVGLVTPQTDPERGAKKTYQYDPHLDPQLVWAGKAEHTSFEVPTVSLHVHERIDPKTIVEAVRKRNRHPVMEQLSLFETPEENPPLREAIEFNTNAEHSTAQFLVADLMELPLINRYGNVNEIAGAFGDKHKPVEAIQRLRPLAHAA